ncbi:hypothetical protein [Streptomyces sp. NPDC007063]|uniref:hypothetical protein n=1 Tax=Streptomyces sp. NPDC007063 TaxID=3364772 RepID=UPI0036AECD00
MLDLTSEQIAAAVSGDSDAVAAVIRELTPRIYYVANEAATVNGHRDAHIADDYASEAVIAVLRALPAFRGDTAGELSKRVDPAIWQAISTARQRERTGGVVYDVNDDNRSVYERALGKCGGDADAAERLCQDVEVYGARHALSPDRAARARAEAEHDALSIDSDRSRELSLLEATDERLAGMSAATDRHRTRVALDELSERSPSQALVLRHAVGVGGVESFGIEYKRTVKREGWQIKDAAGLAEYIGASHKSIGAWWSRGCKAFAKIFVDRFGSRDDARDTSGVTPKGRALVEAVNNSPESVWVRAHGPHVEFVHLNDEGHRVSTWTTRTRAISLGLLEPTAYTGTVPVSRRHRALKALRADVR